MRRKGLWAIFLAGVLLAGCTTTQGSAPYQGAGLGAAVGAVSGALLDRHNPWRGAVIGGAAGAVLGGGITALSVEASKEAVARGQPVVYQEGSTVVEATPREYNQKTYCHKVHKRIWRHGRLVADRIEEVCEGTKTGNYY
ncbi:YMGG-like glycine zipper-containing protein [Thermosulfurimonas marina]|nr:YMGG-like glycine zipper-containing protein [Thermosulfurimonas marina]